jgi:hypothetical protein
MIASASSCGSVSATTAPSRSHAPCGVGQKRPPCLFVVRPPERALHDAQLAIDEPRDATHSPFVTLALTGSIALIQPDGSRGRDAT